KDGRSFSYAVTELPQEIQAKAPAIEVLVKSVYDPVALAGMIADGHESKLTDNRLNDNFDRREFKELWERINSKHAYTVSFDENELRRKSVVYIDEHLSVTRLGVSMTTGTQQSKVTRAALDTGEHFDIIETNQENIDIGTGQGVSYDLVGEVAQAAVITRRSAAAILAGISPLKFDMFRQNPEEFIAKVGKAIVAQKATMVVDHITYHTLDDRYDSEIFTERMPENRSHIIATRKNVQDYVVWDSQTERDFACALDAASEVCVYARLPRSFQIPTPVGNYAPDWAIAFEKGSVKHIYFIAETKGTMETLELKGIESAKIACAKKLFNDISTSEVRYHEVASYGDLLNVIGTME
ncbi:MAG: hypothetical protein ACRC75_10845, partial [Olsenella sp.]